MNKSRIIKISNIIGLVSIILLIYWVFVFVSITVFGFKVFRENLTESFYLSIIGILALMFGALMINIMFNLTKISDYFEQKTERQTIKSMKKSTIAFIASFPLIFILLYTGDKLTSLQKEKYLLSSVKNLTEQYPQQINKITDYSFTPEYIKEMEKTLNFLSKADRNFPYLFIIVNDTVQSSNTFLRIRDYKYDYQSKEPRDKMEYIYPCSKEEREYLNMVFKEKRIETRFSSHDGNYELFYPITYQNKTVVLYLSQYQRYGKIGS